MVRHMDIKITIMKEVYTHRSVETGGIAYHTGLHGERNKVDQQAEKREGRVWPRTFIGVFTGRYR